MILQDAKILRLNKAGMALDWVSRQRAASLIVKDRVVWSHGVNTLAIKGGVARNGRESNFEIPSIIAVDGRVYIEGEIRLTRQAVYIRDKGVCQYCLKPLSKGSFTIDHIIPKSRCDNPDRFENVCLCCSDCNGKKADRTPEEWGVELASVPYHPNKNELLILSNRNILYDQGEFLLNGVSKNFQ